MSGVPRARLMVRGEPGWPPQLEHLDRPPKALWMVGADPLRWPAVAIVGSRHSTAQGREVARDAARSLGARGVQVVSGFARGIDEAAHQGTLEVGGSTAAVLGCGLHVAYPAGHEQLRKAIICSGLLLTEDDGWAQPEGWRFPRRNRLIAALSAAVIVVEATARSGALSTARWAADLGREVLAVPGSIRSDRSDGTNRLIRDGARPFLGIEDVFDAVPDLRAVSGSPASEVSAPAGRPASRPPWGREILDLIGDDTVHPDSLAAELEVDAATLAARLMELELTGAIRTDASGTVARIH